MSSRPLWTPELIKQLERLYPDITAAVVAEKLGVTVRQVYGKAAQLGLRKSDAFNASPASGRTDGRIGVGTRFTKGQHSWNQGMKGLHTGGVETQFAKGHRPKNWKPVGSTRVNIDGYVEIKTSEPKKWEQLQRVRWKETTGDYPPRGMVIAFRDGNKQNCDPDNLELISRADNMRRNTIHNYPEDIKGAIRLLSKVKRKINGQQHR